MKKLMISLVLGLSVGYGFAQVSGGGGFDIPLTVQWEDPTDPLTPLPKSPRRPLVITQDGNVLTIPVMWADYTLELRDENGTVVYTTFVPAGTTAITLPSTLTGDFELRLVADTYYYIGYISL